MTTARTPKLLFKFILFSIIGLCFFFVPINGVTPMVFIVGWLRALLGNMKNYLTLACCTALMITFLLSRFTSINGLKKYHANDGWGKGIFFILAAIFSFLVTFNLGPAWFLDPDLGAGLAVNLAGTVLITVSVAGLMVVFILNSGAVEFLGALLERLMRPVFKLPGRAAIDCLASFVAAPAVGVYFTDMAYKMRIYTQKEAFCVMTCWSVVSLGFFALIVSLAGIETEYGKVVFTSLILCFILSFINIRIWPWSKRPSVYIDGTVQTAESLQESRPTNGYLNKALDDGLMRVTDFDLAKFRIGVIDALSFTQKIVGYVAAIATFALLLSSYTPVFTWIGAPFVPILKLCGFSAADAVIMAPAVLVGISEIALPSILVNGASTAGAFFIVVLSSVQIIFFTESANAMLESSIKVNTGQLIIVFLMRTIIAIPLLAIVTAILY